MKKISKILMLLLVAMLAMAIGVTALATTPETTDTPTGHTISVTSGDTHQYKVFQVLTGTLSEAGSYQLGDPAWGADATDEAKAGSVNDFITSITADGLSKEDIAKLVVAKVDTTKDGRGTLSKDAPITDLATGYYVLVDVTEITENEGKIDTKALHIVEVLNDIEGISIKYGTVEDKKEITSDTLGKGDANTSIDDEGATDNVSVGDTVNYKITAKVPSNADLYDTFFFIINDTLSDGLDLVEDSIQVYHDSINDDNKLGSTEYNTKTGEDAGDYSFRVALTNPVTYKGKDIIVTYSAVLNSKAVIGEEGNPNTSTVTYSNNPNEDYDGDKDNDNPGFPKNENDDAYGETPASETKTYTTGIEIQKVDQDGNVLTGATFSISGNSVQTVLNTTETFEVDDEGDYYKLKDGKYTKTAPTTEGEYMVKTAGATEGYVIDASGDKEVDGVKYRAYKPAEDEGKDVYVLHTGNGHLYEDTSIKYKKSTTKTAVDGTASDYTVSNAVDSNGLVRFDGLGKGTYTISETVTPSGYNTVSDITVTVEFDSDGATKWSFNGGEGAYDEDEGIYKITIQNNKGSELPSTGGIGTTIFYIGGSILVLAALILLVTRRRMSAND